VKFPFTFPTPGAPENATLDYGRYLPIQYSPGYDIHNRMPYAEHYNFSIQRELSKSTVLTLAYVGTQGHKLISQHDADPGNAALCMQLNAMGATDLTTSSTGWLLSGERYLSASGRLEGLQYPELSGRQLLPYLLDSDLLFPKQHLHQKQRQLQLQLVPGQPGAQSRRCDIPDGVHVLQSHR